MWFNIATILGVLLMVLIALITNSKIVGRDIIFTEDSFVINNKAIHFGSILKLDLYSLSVERIWLIIRYFDSGKQKTVSVRLKIRVLTRIIPRTYSKKTGIGRNELQKMINSIPESRHSIIIRDLAMGKIVSYENIRKTFSSAESKIELVD